MKKYKNIILVAGIVLVAVALTITLCLVLKKDKKETKKEEPTKTLVKKYKIDDINYENLTITNIGVETYEDYSVLSLTIKNNSDVAYNEGIMSFKVSADEVLIDDVTSYVSTIEPHDFVEVEIVLNDAYDNINSVQINQ